MKTKPLHAFLFLIHFSVLIIFSSFFIAPVFSQQIKFQRTIGDTVTQSGVKAWQTSDGGYIVSGTASFNSSNSDMFLMKLDSVGNKLWVKTYGNSNTFITGAGWPTWDGNYLLSGTIKINNVYHQFHIKTDSIGDTLWVKKETGNPNGSVQWIIDAKPIGYYLIYPGGLSKIDTAGNLLWYKDYFGGALIRGIPSGDGGLILTGSYWTSASDVDCALIKMDSDGNVQWTKTYGTSANWEFGHGVCQTQDKGYAIVGATQPPAPALADILCIKTDSLGNLQWAKTYGGTMQDAGQNIEKVFGGVGYVFTCETMGFEPPPYQNGVRTGLIRIDNNGNYLWAKMYGGVIANSHTGDQAESDLMRTKDNGFLLSGKSSSFTINGNYTGWIIKTDINGNSGCNETNNSLTIGTPTFVIGSGGYDSTVIITFSDTTITIGTWQAKDSLLCLTTPLGIEQNNSIENAINISPNPFSETATLRITNPRNTNYELKIYDVLGRELFPVVIRNSSSFVISRGDLSEGIYFYRITSSDRTEVATGKLVVE